MMMLIQELEETWKSQKKDGLFGGWPLFAFWLSAVLWKLSRFRLRCYGLNDSLFTDSSTMIAVYIITQTVSPLNENVLYLAS